MLFFTLKGLTGRRLLQLCSLPTTSLKGGRIVFPPEINKSRKPEYARVPEPIFKELEAIAGPNYLWDRYSQELNDLYRKKGRLKAARCREYQPTRFKGFLQDEITAYTAENKDKPGFRAFTAHNFRDTAMTKAWDAEIDLDRAAIAYGCNRETMKKHYIRKDAVAVADAVFFRVQSRANGVNGKTNGQSVESPVDSPQDDGQPKTGVDRPAE